MMSSDPDAVPLADMVAAIRTFAHDTIAGLGMPVVPDV
jgi:hypothetical protein